MYFLLNIKQNEFSPIQKDTGLKLLALFFVICKNITSTLKEN